MAKTKKNKPKSGVLGTGMARTVGMKVEQRDKKNYDKALQAEAALNAALGIKKKKK